MTNTRRANRAGRVAAFVVAALSATAFATAADTEPTSVTSNLARRVSFDIPAQPLPSALAQFSAQSGLEFSASTDIVEGKQATAVKGVYATQEALRVLLTGTGLEFTATGGGIVAIRKIPSATSTRPGASAADEQSVTPAGGLEEIIVTATKRAQSIQDVPLSMSALTSEEIARRGLVSAEDYLRGIPSVNQVGETFGTAIVIRGIETSPHGQNFGSGTTVATYFGETSTTNSAGLSGGANVDLKLVDIDRVEVLRGPQGTSFGNSSLGGAVRTIPVAPRLDRVEGKVAASYSVTAGSGGDNDMVQAVGNFPIVPDKLAIRAVAYRFQDSGYYQNTAGSDPAFRASIVLPYGVQAFAVDKSEVGASRFTGGRVAASFRASDDLSFMVTYLTQKTEIDGFARANTGTYQQNFLQVAPEHVVRGQKGGLLDTDVDIANAVMDYKLGWAHLLATYSYVKGGTTYVAPFSPAWSELGPSEHREHSGEIRLTTDLPGRWSFLAGLYAEKLDDEGSFNDIWYGTPESEQTFIPGAGRALGDYVDVRHLKQRAAFGEASWEFLPHFTLTAGARAYRFERAVRVDQSGPFYGGTTSNSNDADASGTSFRGNLSYKPNATALLYAGFSQGFRLGKPQPGLQAGICDRDGDGVVDGTGVTLEQTRSTKSDSVDNFELGTRLSLLDRKLSVAADVFYIDWSGVPFQVQPPCGFVYNANAGSAVSRGVELEASLYLTERLRLDAGGAWVNAELTEDVPSQQAFDGDRLPGSPKVNGNLGLQYEFNVAGYKAFVRADSIYVGTFYGDLRQSATLRAGNYTKVDLSTRVTIADLDVDLFVRNLTNVDEFTFRGIFAGDSGSFYGYRPRPRTVGLQLAYRF